MTRLLITLAASLVLTGCHDTNPWPIVTEKHIRISVDGSTITYYYLCSPTDDREKTVEYYIEHRIQVEPDFDCKNGVAE